MQHLRCKTLTDRYGYNSNTTLLTTAQEEAWNISKISEFKYEDEDVRIAYLIILPIHFVFGTIGNLLTFVVMQRGSLKDSSTCFYMAILALADRGEFYLFLYGNFSIG